jgi:hypothetical protein
MSDGRALTRRSLLAAGAGAFAAGTLGADVARAALGGPPAPRLAARRLGRLTAGTVRSVELGEVADLLGLSWSGVMRAGVQLRFRTASGAWSRWASADAGGHGPDGPAPASGGRVVGDPVWTGGTSAVQIRSRIGLADVTLHLVDASGGVGAARQVQAAVLAVAPALAGPPLAAGPGQPPIIARAAWAAGVSRPRVAPEYGAVRMAFVHHTENPNGYAPGEVPAMLRAIWAFHRFVRGWNDIGYNFVIDLFGRIFEARAGGIDEPVVGAQAGGYNLLSTGVAVLGSFMSVPVSPQARGALERLLAWKLSLHGVPSQGRVVVRVNPAGAVYSRFPAGARVPLPRIAGHRDGDTTDCPGNVLYAELPAIRAGVRRLAPRPVHLSLTLTPAVPTLAPSAGQPPTATAPAAAPGAAAAGVLGGVLAFLDGTPVPGAPVIVQSRTVRARGETVLEGALAEARTDAEGRWSVPGEFVTARRGGLRVRALYPGGTAGAGASVSEALDVVAQPLTPPGAAPAPTPAASAPPAG